MLEYLKDWRIWLVCLIIVIVIENPITGWCFENEKGVNWGYYANGLLQHDNDIRDEQMKLNPNIWNEYDKDPYAKNKKSKPQVGFKALSLRWHKFNAIQTRCDVNETYLNLRYTTRFDISSLGARHKVENIIRLGGSKEISISSDFNEKLQVTPMVTFAFRW